MTALHAALRRAILLLIVSAAVSASAQSRAEGRVVDPAALNLFDRRYEPGLGFPSPGRTAFAGVRVAAGR